MRNQLILAIALATTIVTASEARAHHEEFRPHVLSEELTCPENTRRVVEQLDNGAQEYCVDQKAQRHGYFLRWFAQGSWAELGRFVTGHKDGRWAEFLPDGRIAAVSFFRKGLRYMPWKDFQPRIMVARASR